VVVDGQAVNEPAAIPMFTNSAGTWPTYIEGPTFGTRFRCRYPVSPDFGKWVQIRTTEYYSLLGERDALRELVQPAKEALLSELDKLRARIAST
jgi:hypothetical protein